MEYVPPVGSTDPNAAYQDRNSQAAVSGSRVPAAAIEHAQREIVAVITGAGMTPDKKDLTQLWQAIQNMIDAATGGTGDDNYVLMAAARARLPIFPETQTADGTLSVISPSTGLVRLMPGYSFLHRGIYMVTTVQSDFATVGSKTYHLRWNPTDGYALKDLADSGYNPGALPETNAAFDTTYDNMLIARVVTNASNVATITALSNKNRLLMTQDIPGAINGPDTGGATSDIVATYNWARTPKTYCLTPTLLAAGNGIQYWQIFPQGPTNVPQAYNVNRYKMAHTILVDELFAFIAHVTAEA